MRTFVLAEIKPCPNGWDSDNCYDSGRGLNPCGDRNQHCLGNGTCLEYASLPPSGWQRTNALLDLINCECGPEEWTERLQGGDPFDGAGVSIWACALCRGLKSSAIAAGWGTCESHPGV